MSTSSPEVMELFDILESNRQEDVNEIKRKFTEMFNSTREPWLVAGLVEYHVSTGSMRPIEILARAPESHGQHLFAKLQEGLREPSWKAAALSTLGHLVRRQPSWLHRIAHHPLLRDLLRLLRSDADAVAIVSALLVLITLMPMVPTVPGAHLPEICEVFKRLAAWDCSARGDARPGRREHLQLGLYALFHALYGMYPCNFVEFLRREYAPRDAQDVFAHTVRPMLETARMHPHLVTATRGHETAAARWEKMEHHDILVECRRFSLEGDERAPADDPFRARCATDAAGLAPEARLGARAHTSAPNLTRAPTFTRDTLTTCRVEPGSLGQMSRDAEASRPAGEDWFSLRDACEAGPATSAPHTPLPVTAQEISRTPIAEIPGSVRAHDGGSPPEAAVEATPENTPVKDGRSKFSFPGNSAAVRCVGGRPYLHPSSQPPSPLKKEHSPFSKITEYSDNQDGSKDSFYNSKFVKIIHERSQASARVPVPGSPLRRPTPAAAPDSPIPIGAGAPESGSTEWPLAKPKPSKAILSLDRAVTNYSDSSNKEDSEVKEISERSEAMRGTVDGDGGPDLMENKLQSCKYPGDMFSLEENAAWDNDEIMCESADRPCGDRKHGLHMPQSTSMLDFARRVTTRYRFRFLSQCTLDPLSSSLTKSIIMGADGKPARDGKTVKASSWPDLKRAACTSVGSSETSSNRGADFKDIATYPASVVNNFKSSKTKSAETQTVDAWPFPHEHLLSGILENFYDHPARNKHNDCVQLIEQKARFSPYEQLDRYIDILANSKICNYPYSNKANEREENERLREQLQLMQLQLQYERHCKEVHAMRNRRLLGKSRKNNANEEQNAALQQQLKQFQLENEQLRLQLSKQQSVFQFRENHFSEEIESKDNKISQLVCELEQQNRRHCMLLGDYEGLQKKHSEESADVQHLHSALFELSQQMEKAAKKSEMNDKLVDYVRLMQRELIFCGERETRAAEFIAAFPPSNDVYLNKLLKQYEDKVLQLQDTLAAQSSRLEALQARETEADHARQQRDLLLQDHKKQIVLIKEEYQEKLKTMEDKYQNMIRINQKLEDHGLDLLQRVPSSPHTSRDVTSGFSPASSPLSVSLASSDGHASLRVDQIRNLQKIVNQAEGQGEGPSEEERR